jgi:hypothetical protein
MGHNVRKLISPSLVLGVALSVYFLGVVSRFPILGYRFDRQLLTRYLCSQDIPQQPPCVRTFLSDSEIHIAAGFLYAVGADPQTYNFQHPPLVKYGYGLSAILTGNPLLFQATLGVGIIVAVYLLSRLMFGGETLAAGTTILFAADPLTHNVGAYAMLDLGQTLFFIIFVWLALSKRSPFIVGVFFGLSCASKYWTTPALCSLPVIAYWILEYQKDTWKRTFIFAGVALAVVTLSYGSSFVQGLTPLDFAKFQLRILKYWIQHTTSVESSPGALVFLYLTGWYQQWWGARLWGHVREWSFLWTVSVVGVITALVTRRTLQWVTCAGIVGLFFVVTLRQTPSARYIYFVLPFVHLFFVRGTSDLVLAFMRRFDIMSSSAKIRLKRD